MGGVSGPEVEPSLGRASIDDETGAEIGDDTVDASVVANTVVGMCLTPTTGAMLGGKMLKSTESTLSNVFVIRAVDSSGSFEPLAQARFEATKVDKAPI